MKYTPQPTEEEIAAVFERQVERTRQAHNEAGYNVSAERERVATLSQRYGSPALDVGTGACACMAVAMARRGLSVMAIDHASSAVRLAQERATGGLSGRLEVRFVDAVRLPFPDHSYRVVTMFDALCHAAHPKLVVKEVFRVCAPRGAVLITELNAAGRQITRHLNEGFEEKLPAFLAPHCRDCQQLDSAYHITYVCET
jgi:ubiquinone/menaquinone biosynthesis C-methylase UbiE